MLFQAWFVENVTSNDLLINIDECSVSRHTRERMSWSAKGYDQEFNALCFRGSVSVITAVSSDGWHFSHVHSSSIGGAKFSGFIKDLAKFLRSSYRTPNRRIIVFLDNSSVHKARTVTAALKALCDFVCFLPTYTPQYAPVENFFSVFKSSLTKGVRTRWIDLGSPEGRSNVKLALREVRGDFIFSIWASLVKRITKDFKCFISQICKS